MGPEGAHVIEVSMFPNLITFFEVAHLLLDEHLRRS